MPEPIELFCGDVAMRGYRWAGDANTILLLHDVGADLDVWGDLPAQLAADGFSVLAVDLPGHGLSDDPWEPTRASDVVRCLAESVKPPAARCFVVAAGSLSVPALRAPGIDALVALSPSGPEVAPLRPTPPTLVLVGGADSVASASADRFFRDTRGWTVFSSFGTTVQSTGLYSSEWGNHVLEQTLIFFRDYRA